MFPPRKKRNRQNADNNFLNLFDILKKQQKTKCLCNNNTIPGCIEILGILFVLGVIILILFIGYKIIEWMLSNILLVLGIGGVAIILLFIFSLLSDTPTSSSVQTTQKENLSVPKTTKASVIEIKQKERPDLNRPALSNTEWKSGITHPANTERKVQKKKQDLDQKYIYRRKKSPELRKIGSIKKYKENNKRFCKKCKVLMFPKLVTHGEYGVLICYKCGFEKKIDAHEILVYKRSDWQDDIAVLGTEDIYKTVYKMVDGDRKILMKAKR